MDKTLWVVLLVTFVATEYGVSSPVRRKAMKHHILSSGKHGRLTRTIQDMSTTLDDIIDGLPPSECSQTIASLSTTQISIAVKDVTCALVRQFVPPPCHDAAYAELFLGAIKHQLEDEYSLDKPDNLYQLIYNWDRTVHSDDPFLYMDILAITQVVDLVYRPIILIIEELDKELGVLRFVDDFFTAFRRELSSTHLGVMHLDNALRALFQPFGFVDVTPERVCTHIDVMGRMEDALFDIVYFFENTVMDNFTALAVNEPPYLSSDDANSLFGYMSVHYELPNVLDTIWRLHDDPPNNFRTYMDESADIFKDIYFGNILGANTGSNHDAPGASGAYDYYAYYTYPSYSGASDNPSDSHTTVYPTSPSSHYPPSSQTPPSSSHNTSQITPSSSHNTSQTPPSSSHNTSQTPPSSSHNTSSQSPVSVQPSTTPTSLDVADIIQNHHDALVDAGVSEASTMEVMTIILKTLVNEAEKSGINRDIMTGVIQRVLESISAHGVLGQADHLVMMSSPAHTTINNVLDMTGRIMQELKALLENLAP